MKLTYAHPAESGWVEIRAERTDFDGFPPIDRFRIQWPLGEANVDRTAVAASLIFSPWIAGRCDHGRPFSALTEQRIVSWFQHHSTWVAPNPVRAGGLPLPIGTRRLRVSGAPTGAPDEDLLRLVPSGYGSGREGNEHRIASNLAALGAGLDSDLVRLQMRLGVAVLVADSLSANELIDEEFAAYDPASFDAAARLLECTALGLRDA